MPKVLWAYCHNINPICPKYFGHIVKWSRKYRKICPNSVTYIIIDNGNDQHLRSRTELHMPTHQTLNTNKIWGVGKDYIFCTIMQ